MHSEPSQLQVSRVSIAATGRPRVEIGDIVAGPGAVFTVVEDLLVILERACLGARLTGPFRVDATAEAALLATLELELELSEESSRFNDAALRTAVDFLVRHIAEPLGRKPGEARAAADPALRWDEANGDVC
jgi:hypothetical protein